MNKNKEYNRYPKEKMQYFKLYSYLFTQPEYSDLSTDAKVLYCIMLARCELSEKEGWIENGRVYIYFTIEEIMIRFNCGCAKAVRILDELDERKGKGLIERKKQGWGKPAMIFVNDFATSDSPDADFHKTKDKSFENENSEAFKLENKDFSNSKKNNKENKYIKNKYKDNIHSEKTDSACTNTNKDTTDRYDRRMMYKDIIKANINYPVLVETCGNVWLDQIVELMVGIVCTTKNQIKIGSEIYPADVVRNRFWELDETHIECVYHIINSTNAPIKNIREYLKTVLYHSFETADSWMRARVISDMKAANSQAKAIS